eukprot:scaffold88269_cov63-Phaeocystis_antarctica.AAC.2
MGMGRLPSSRATSAVRSASENTCPFRACLAPSRSEACAPTEQRHRVGPGDAGPLGGLCHPSGHADAAHRADDRTDREAGLGARRRD